MDKWNGEKAVAMLTRNRHRVTENKVIEVHGDCGLKVWGAIDYLCHHEGYSWQKV